MPVTNMLNQYILRKVTALFTTACQIMNSWLKKRTVLYIRVPLPKSVDWLLESQAGGEHSVFSAQPHIVSAPGPVHIDGVLEEQQAGRQRASHFGRQLCAALQTLSLEFCMPLYERDNEMKSNNTIFVPESGR